MEMNSKIELLDPINAQTVTLGNSGRKYRGLSNFLCAVAFFLGLEFHVFGANTFTAASTSAADVQNAINKAHDGDTVLVPAGSATWTSEVIVSNAITLQGAGINSTIITSSLNPALWANNDNKGELQISGFTFNGAGAEGFGVVSLTGYQVRMDNCLITNCALFSASSYDGYGVIDHCIFDERDGGIYVQDPDYGGDENGDGSWATGDNWGTTNFMYVENCQFYGVGQVGAMDGCAGARWVFRYNYVTNDILVAHGTDTTGRPRGTRAVEVYDNTFVCPGGFAETFELRSGTAVIYSNNCTGYNGNIVTLKNFRSASCGVPGTYPPWGACTGSDPYDGNTDTNGYPAIDQCGRGQGDLMADNAPGSGIPIDTVTKGTNWPKEVSDPVYAWGNYNNGVSCNVGECSGVIVEGRDYFNNVVKPGYTPLVYPHPLDVAPPTNLKVVP